MAGWKGFVSNMIDYKIWEPKHDGHAPPNWREGMVWGFEGNPPKMCHADPSWFVDITYLVPAEALNSPNDDAETPDAVETGKLENIVRGLRQYPAETLAKHGITLAPEKDWATDLFVDLLEAWDMQQAARRVRTGNNSDDDEAAIELLRTRFEQMMAERSKRDGNA